MGSPRTPCDRKVAAFVLPTPRLLDSLRSPWSPKIMSTLSRRTFVTGATAITALSYAKIPGANDRLRIGVVGCGGQAMGHMRALVKMRESDNCDVTAVCDVFDKRAEQAAQLTGGKIVKDYRRVLDNPEVDYVLIATPEHWHYQMTLDAVATR